MRIVEAEMDEKQAYYRPFHPVLTFSAPWHGVCLDLCEAFIGAVAEWLAWWAQNSTGCGAAF
jgi:hypothetical protein